MGRGYSFDINSSVTDFKIFLSLEGKILDAVIGFCKITKMVSGCQGTVHIVIINGVSLVDGMLHPDHRLFWSEIHRISGICLHLGLIASMKMLLGWLLSFSHSLTAHDAVFCNLSIQKHFNDIVKLHTGFFQGCVQFFRLHLVSRESIKQPSVFTVVLF